MRGLAKRLLPRHGPPETTICHQYLIAPDFDLERVHRARGRAGDARAVEGEGALVAGALEARGLRLPVDEAAGVRAGGRERGDGAAAAHEPHRAEGDAVLARPGV